MNESVTEKSPFVSKGKSSLRKYLIPIAVISGLGAVAGLGVLLYLVFKPKSNGSGSDSNTPTPIPPPPPPAVEYISFVVQTSTENETTRSRIVPLGTAEADGFKNVGAFKLPKFRIPNKTDPIYLWKNGSGENFFQYATNDNISPSGYSFDAALNTFSAPVADGVKVNICNTIYGNVKRVRVSLDSNPCDGSGWFKYLSFYALKA